MWSCTCHHPHHSTSSAVATGAVDLTAAFSVAVDSSGRKATTERVGEHYECKQSLEKTLSQFGWCMVSVDLTQLQKTHRSNSNHNNNNSEVLPSAPACCCSFLQSIQPLAMKQHVQDLFDPSFVESMTKRSSGGTVAGGGGGCCFYRGRLAESGSQQEEPKQLWEVRRCCLNSTNGNRQHTSHVPIVLRQWTRAMHSIALAITRVLGLAPNVLVKEDACHCAETEAGATSTHDEGRCNIDLLRVFLYDAVSDNNTSTNDDDDVHDGAARGASTVSLGSSPHTDWGSLTVVWQDDVGGLQTYCQEHKTWVNVPAPPQEASRVFFVVHVGDVTSLAMGHALMSGQKEERVKKEACTHTDSTGGSTPAAVTKKVVWPSPRHRVLSPTKSNPRVSLVYFVYPPPAVSLSDMEKLLSGAYKEKKPGVELVIPYEEYSLLQNQAPVSGGNSTACTTSSRLALTKETYATIRSRPLGGVFDEKWQQVQRTAPSVEDEK